MAFRGVHSAASGAQEPHNTPIDNWKGFWMFDSASAAVAGKATARAGNTAIPNTGTTLALMEDTVCKAIYDAIPGGRTIQVSRATSSLPTRT
ncbi:MAG: hypothetical protein Q9163_000089 [Psora crenata]